MYQLELPQYFSPSLSYNQTKTAVAASLPPDLLSTSAYIYATSRTSSVYRTSNVIYVTVYNCAPGLPAVASLISTSTTLAYFEMPLIVAPGVALELWAQSTSITVFVRAGATLVLPFYASGTIFLEGNAVLNTTGNAAALAR